MRLKITVIFLMSISLLLFSFNIVLATMVPIDFIKSHEEALIAEGVSDLSNEGLIYTLKNTDNNLIAYDAILLLARRGVKEAIPVIKVWLNKTKRPVLEISSAEALLLLGSDAGVPNLLKICNKDNGVDSLSAAGILAEHGYFESMQYLLKFSKSDNWAFRMSTIRYLTKLIEKVEESIQIEKTRGKELLKFQDQISLAVDELLSLIRDKDNRVKTWALDNLSSLKIKDKKLIYEGLEKLLNNEKNKNFADQIRLKIQNFKKITN